MKKPRCLLRIILAASISSTAHAQDTTVTLPAAAQADHAAAMTAYVAGDDAAALAGFQRAYGRLMDPLADRQGRDFVLGSLRSTWARLYERSHDRRHLCDWRAALQTHADALRQALGAAVTPADTAGFEDLLAEVDRDLARDFPADPRCTPPDKPTPVLMHEPPAPVEPTPTVSLHSPKKDLRAERLRRAGIVTVSLGVANLIGMTTALIVADDRQRRIEEFHRGLSASGRPAVSSDFEYVAQLRDQGLAANTAAVVTGVLGGLLVVPGVALLVVGRKHPSPVTVAPQAGTWGLSLRGRF